MLKKAILETKKKMNINNKIHSKHNYFHFISTNIIQIKFKLKKQIITKI
jgi:hypothetical protein